MENIQIHSVLVLNLLLELLDLLHSICYLHRICRLQTAILQSHLSHQIMSNLDQNPFQISSWFSYKEFFLFHVPLSQHVHGTHAEIVVIIQLDGSINT